MSRNWRIYLNDILESSEKVQRFTADMKQSDFLEDERTYDAVVRNIEIIGEAAKHIPDDIRQAMSSIEWRKAAGLRDMIAHAYFGIDNDILWDVIKNKVPELASAIKNFLKDK